MDASISPTTRRVLGELNPNASPSFPSPRRTSLKPQLRQQENRVVASSQKPQQQLGSPVKLRRSETESESARIRLPTGCAEMDSESAKRLPDGYDSPDTGDQEPTRKRSRLDQDDRIDRENSGEVSDSEGRQRSASPDRSSVFDNSALDTSHATNVTEPDVDGQPVPNAPVTPAAPAARAAPRRLTPQETRDRAEALRLRLALANYKIRTGQTHLPLEQLQPLPVRVEPGSLLDGLVGPFVSVFGRRRGPGAVTAAPSAGPVSGGMLQDRTPAQPFRIRDARNELIDRVRRPLPNMACRQAPPIIAEEDDSVTEEEEEHGAADRDELPVLPQPQPQGPRAAANPSAPNTPERPRPEDDERQSSSALRGGAASGLLSLSRS